MFIRRLRRSDLRAFRTLRLKSLQIDPAAFGSTLELEAAYPDAKWEDWCVQGAGGNESATFLAEGPGGRLVGMAGAFSEGNTFVVWGMWVAPEARRLGLGRELLASVLEWAHAAGPARPIRLEVNPEQVAAVNLYETLGFRFTGSARPLGHHPPAVRKEMLRELPHVTAP
jgi:ribosomal protein S18 acetylase RimI-like enzyme